MNPFKTISVALLVLLFASCTKDEEQASGVGDVMIVSRNSGTNTVYGISMYAYTYSSFKTVNASSSAEGGKTYTLKANQGFKTNFYYETPDAEYTKTKPVASIFNFSAVFESGITDEFQDELSSKVLAPPVIDTCQYNTSKHMLRLTWTPVTDAESYVINIMEGSSLVFGTPELPNSFKAVSINAKSSGWTNSYTPVAGKTYKVKLFAYLYETEKTAYNLQCVSIAEADVVWGE